MTDADNMAIWNGVCRVPAENLKSFTRAGGFRGTAIRPIWSIKTMTEHFGPAGQGWSIGKPEFTLVNANNEILVYCTVCVTIGEPSGQVWGVGGDKVLASGSSGLRSDDEAFKKAYTDALTNALVKLGVGADIHMGLWDGNKYVDDELPQRAEQQPPASTPRQALKNVTGAPATPKAQSREAFDKILKGIHQIEREGGHDDLTKWYRNHVKEIETWDAGWHQQIMEKFSEARDALVKRIGSPTTKQTGEAA